MKRGLILFLILLLPFMSAVSFDMKSEYSQGETMIVKISGDFYDTLTESDIFFYRGHVRVSIAPHLTKINNDYYVYAQLPVNVDEYSLRIEGVRYYQGSSIVDDDIIQYFSINSSTADFQVSPGFVKSDDFSLEIKNLKSNTLPATLKIDTKTGTQGNFYSSTFGEFSEGEEKSFSVSSLGTKTLYLEINQVEQASFKIITLSSANTEYEVPLYVYANYQSEKSMQFNESDLQITIPTGEQLNSKIKLKNTGEETLTNIGISPSSALAPYLTIYPTSISSLAIGQEREINLYFESSSSEKVVNGILTAQTNEVSSLMDLQIVYYDEYQEPEDTCASKGGVICTSPKFCSGETTDASDLNYDDVCCITGTCIEEDPDLTCSEQGGNICRWGDICTGDSIDASDIYFWQKCCVNGNCIDEDEEDETCSGKGGVICTSPKFCSGETTDASDLNYDDVCCITGTCIEEDENKTCLEQKGRICNINETCTGTKINASDLDSQETCCINGPCKEDQNKTCTDQDGKICSSGEYCYSGKIINASDLESKETCCFDGTCEQEDENKTCSEQGGEICSSGQFCSGGSEILSSDIKSEQICCISGICEEEQSAFETCTEMGGVICNTGYKCSGETVNAKDGICCKGSCEKENETDSYKWIGWGIIGLVFIIIIAVLKKYKGVKGETKLPFKISKK